jgi:hypothetical protein
MGALAVRRVLSAELVEMGEPPAGLFEPTDLLRERFRDACAQRAPVRLEDESDAYLRARIRGGT